MSIHCGLQAGSESPRLHMILCHVNSRNALWWRSRQARIGREELVAAARGPRSPGGGRREQPRGVGFLSRRWSFAATFPPTVTFPFLPVLPLWVASSFRQNTLDPKP